MSNITLIVKDMTGNEDMRVEFRTVKWHSSFDGMDHEREVVDISEPHSDPITLDPERLDILDEAVHKAIKFRDDRNSS